MALGRRVRAASDEAADPGVVDAARRRVLAGWPARRRLPARGVALVAALAAAALIAAIALFPRRPAITYVVAGEPAPGRVGAWIAAEHEATPLRFSEGTVVTLASGSRARVTSADADGASVLLEQGAVRARVVHAGPATRWRMHAGPFEVAVVGTEFDLAWDPGRDALDITMMEGRVVVSGPLLGDGRALLAGERLRVSVREGVSEVSGGLGRRAPSGDLEPQLSNRAGAAERPRAAAEPAAPARTAEAAVPPAPPGGAEPSQVARGAAPGGWRALAAAGRHREAMAEVEREGFERVAEGATAPA
ncbi:MAG: FecR domain-containing protein, partial [Polyangiaceae bacterium]|nr:FecR domain-containing protein [Polyangiaceae bacterium]